ncbi:MAG: hypothetical protein M1835_002891, partial [Candelina submexicana]
SGLETLLLYYGTFTQTPVYPARGSEDLQGLLRNYVGYEMSVLMKDEDFKVLMIEDGRSLLHDFMKMAAKRIS